MSTSGASSHNQPWRWALPVALAAALGLWPLPLRGAAVPSLPGPAPQARAEGFDVAAENAHCETCHSDIAREWRGSLHRKAWDDPVFRAAYTLEPLAFCRGCHAPEASPAQAPGVAARAVGVGCVTCHVQGGEVMGARAVAARKGRHAVRADARFGTDQACARCHQFDFPLRPGAPMQDTVNEHRTGKLTTTTCQSCHMPRLRSAGGRSHKSHSFRVLGDSAMLRSAVRAAAARTTPQAITVTLEAANVGHAFPTGDMFRRLEVRAEILDADDKVISRARSVVLERKFAVRVSAKGIDRVQTADTRLPSSGAPREVLLLFADDIGGRRVRWEVAYQRLSKSMAVTFGVDSAADEVIVATGTLVPPPPPPPAKSGP